MPSLWQWMLDDLHLGVYGIAGPPLSLMAGSQTKFPSGSNREIVGDCVPTTFHTISAKNGWCD
jgi:hypothetical protein